MAALVQRIRARAASLPTFDIPFLLILLLLLSYGLIMLFSAGYAVALYRRGDAYTYIHRTIPALRLKHRSGGCGTASALPKCSIIHKVLSALLA